MIVVPIQMLIGGNRRGTVTLSGTAGAPNSLNLDTGMGATVTWTFTSAGGVQLNGSPFNDGTEWIDIDNPPEPYYLRASHNSGDNPTSGDSLDTWLAVSGPSGSPRTFVWTDGSGAGILGSVKIEIALSSTGGAVQDFGFYGADLNN